VFGLCKNEIDHLNRAVSLRIMFDTPAKLAEFLHQNFRAAAKSFEVKGPKAHDHGWCDCYGEYKQYFLRRAQWLMTNHPNPNGSLKK
jgi:hypothetical protein